MADSDLLKKDLRRKFETALDIDILTIARKREVGFHISDARRQLRDIREMIRTFELPWGTNK